MEPEINAQPPRDNLVRANLQGLELRSEETDDGSLGTLCGHFAIFNEWTEISSVFEGRFLERFMPGSLKRTINNNGARMKVLFHHGRDPQVGTKPLGPIAVLEEDETGGYYEVPLIDTSYTRDLIPGLKAGLYGSSFRFGVVQEKVVRRPGISAHNPDGLPERTVLEARVVEFGPTPFPAYAGATSGVRSLTDEVMFGQLLDDPERVEAIARARRAGVSVPRALERDGDEARSRLYKRTSEYVSQSPWVMHPAMIATVANIVAERKAGVALSDEEIKARIGVRDAGEPAEASAGVAVIRLWGPIVPHASMFTRTSGLMSCDDLRSQLDAALADGNVTAIVLDIDSPGGSAALVPELAAEILAAREVKPIVAVANSFCASGAYWLASACSEISITPSGYVGSIGCYTAHEDWSKADAMKGVATTLVFAETSPYKVEGNEFEPLSDEAKAELQRHVDFIGERFVAAVAEGRGVTAKTVLADFGGGRMLNAPDALAAGMVDRIETIDQTLARLAASVDEDDADETDVDTDPEPPAEPQPEPNDDGDDVSADPAQEATPRTSGTAPLWFTGPEPSAHSGRKKPTTLMFAGKPNDTKE